MKQRNMNIKKSVLILVVWWLGTGVLPAQDTKVTHPFMWKSFNNPAYTGFNGLAGVSIGMQKAYWSNPLDFRSYFVAADYAFQEKRTFGLGGVSCFISVTKRGH